MGKKQRGETQAERLHHEHGGGSRPSSTITCEGEVVTLRESAEELDALREAKAGLEDEVASLASRVERVSSERQEHETLAQQHLASAMELRKELADTQADAAAHAAELEQLQEAHGQLQSDSESHIERQRELTTQVQNELEALRKQRQSAGADHQAAAETLTMHQEPRLHEDKMGQKLRATTEATASLHAIGTATTQRRNGPVTAPPATTSHTPEIPPTCTTTLFPSPIPVNGA